MIQIQKQRPSHGDLKLALEIKTRKDTLEMMCFRAAPKLGSGVFLFHRGPAMHHIWIVVDVVVVKYGRFVSSCFCV